MPNQIPTVTNPQRGAALYRAIAITSGAIDKLPGKEEYRYEVHSRLVHHYTDLSAARLLIESGNVWLSDARYCNDRREMAHAADEVRKVFNDLTASKLINLSSGQHQLTQREQADLGAAQSGYDSRLPQFIAFVCCLCAGQSDDLQSSPQDILSQWRAYGSNGQGACVSFNGGSIEQAITDQNTNRREPGFLFEPVLYETAEQRTIIETLIVEKFEERQRPLPGIDVQGLAKHI
jgi:hypothetical protein